VAVISYASSGRSWPLPAADFNTGRAGPGQYEVPYGISTISAYALAATRYMHQYGLTSEQLAQIAVQMRAYAANNPEAMYRDPLTVNDVLSSPMISTSLHKLDCCVVSDSGGAIVVTSKDRAKDTRRSGPVVLGFGEAVGPDADEPDGGFHHHPPPSTPAVALSRPRASDLTTSASRRSTTLSPSRWR